MTRVANVTDEGHEADKPAVVRLKVYDIRHPGLVKEETFKE